MGAQNTAHDRNNDSAFVSVAYFDEICGIFGNLAYFFLNLGDKAKVSLRLATTNKQAIDASARLRFPNK